MFYKLMLRFNTVKVLTNVTWISIHNFTKTLPTLTEVHLVGSKGIPSSLLKNIVNVQVSHSNVDPFSVAEGDGVSDPILPKLKSLTLRTRPIFFSTPGLAQMPHQ
jgi:hypothetical protein